MLTSVSARPVCRHWLKGGHSPMYWDWTRKYCAIAQKPILLPFSTRIPILEQQCARLTGSLKNSRRCESDHRTCGFFDKEDDLSFWLLFMRDNTITVCTDALVFRIKKSILR